MLDGFVFLFLDSPGLLQLLEHGFLVEELGDAVEIDPLDEVFTQLHQRVPLGDALHQSGVLLRFLDFFKVVLDLVRQQVVIRVGQGMLLNFLVVIGHEDGEKLLVQDLTVDALAEFSRYLVYFYVGSGVHQIQKFDL